MLLRELNFELAKFYKESKQEKKLAEITIKK
ncbi:hypothetical protein EDC55_10312 [Allofrancisella inopinata]|nr:hypothetical protein EDC55_10312 [Allofrancisella inopinata]